MKKCTLILITLILFHAQTNKGYVAATVCTLMLESARKRQEALLEREKQQLEQEKRSSDATEDLKNPTFSDGKDTVVEPTSPYFLA